MVYIIEMGSLMDITLQEYGFIRVASASPELRIAEPVFNAGKIIEIVRKAAAESCSLLVFPELSITGYTCADLFAQTLLLKAAADALFEISEATREYEIAFAIGLPFVLRGRLFNCAAVVFKGEVLGIIPKTYLPNTGEYYEERWFSSAAEVSVEQIELNGQRIPFGADLLFECTKYGLIFGVELCEDLWAVSPPSSAMAAAGANVILNLSAGSEYLGKAEYRRNLVVSQSARCIAGYVYSSSGPNESSTDLVFPGHLLIAENGVLLAESGRFNFDSQMIFTDIDLDKLSHDRKVNSSFGFNQLENSFRRIAFELAAAKTVSLKRKIEPKPFVPSDSIKKDAACREIFEIQTTALARRLKHTNSRKAILGVSGGLDSTLALIVAYKTFQKMGMDEKGIIAVSMPGFGTTSRTRSNANKLAGLLNSDFREISINQAVEQHFEDIGHDGRTLDITFENSQARERTQILMDLANKEGGIALGTGDLSELALGWATYAGDHISMYGINSGIPKTLVRYIIEWCADYGFDGEIRKLLHDICNTPISPELLPPDENGYIVQKTEDAVGPYMLNDFFLYYFVRYGFSPKKILALASIAFEGEYDSEYLRDRIKYFIKRFFSQQFKRSCLPDGPKVGSVALSPRGDWRMPSDAVCDLWLKDLD